MAYEARQHQVHTLASLSTGLEPWTGHLPSVGLRFAGCEQWAGETKQRRKDLTESRAST